MVWLLRCLSKLWMGLQQPSKEIVMVTPIEESQEEQDDIVVEVEEVFAPSTSKKIRY